MILRPELSRDNTEIPPKLLAFVIAGRFDLVGTKNVFVSLSTFPITAKEREPFPLCPEAWNKNCRQECKQSAY